MEERDYASVLGAAAPNLNQRATDLSSLRDTLQKHIQFARELGFRSHNIADAVFGPTPSAVGVGSDRDRPPPSLAELVNELGSALNSIESGLNRL